MLSGTAIDEAASILVEARRTNSIIDCIPEHVRPTTLREAYAVQDRFIELLGEETKGWFGACTNVAIQELLSLSEPYYARLLSNHVYASPATLDTTQYPPIVFECEFGFQVGHDFTPAGTPYSRDDIENAITGVFPTIEVVAGHLKDWPNQDVFSVIADNGTDGALVVGEGAANWRDIDLINTEVTLSINDAVVRRGTGRKVLDDPLGAFVWMINAITRDGKTVRAGDVNNTGTATDIYWASVGDRARASFGDVGSVELTLV